MIRRTRLDNEFKGSVNNPTRLPEKKALIVSLNYYDSLTPEFGNLSQAKAFSNSLYLYLHFTNIKIISDKPPNNEDNGQLQKSEIMKSLDELFLDYVFGDIIIILIIGKRNKDGFIQLNINEHLNNDEIQKFIVLPIQNGVTVALFVDTQDEFYPSRKQNNQESIQTLGLRYLHEKYSYETITSLKSSAHLGFRIPIDIQFKNNQILTTEFVSVEETSSTFITLSSCTKKSSILTFALIQIITNNYLHTLTLKKFINEIVSFFIVNFSQNNNELNFKENNCIYFESGQHIDMQVPLGRILSAPL
jgi:hypothetical protein